MKKNDVLTVEIIDLGVNGEGIARVNDIVVFVPFTLIGETVEVKILKAERNLAFAKVIKILQKSGDRVDAPCEVFGKCGGCQLQHLRYEKQLEFKRESVRNNLRKIANLEVEIPPCEPSENCYNYRNKLQLPIGEIAENIDKNSLKTDKKSKNIVKIKNVLGFYAPFSNRIVPIKKCHLHGEWCDKLIEIFERFIAVTHSSCYNFTTKKGDLKHLVARYLQNKLMITVVINADYLKNKNVLTEMLKKEFNNFSLYENINKMNTNVVFGDKFNLLYGSGEQELEIFGINFSVSPQSFLQVNFDIQNKIYSDVLEMIKENSTVINGYSGAGLLSAILSKKAVKVYGIEIEKEATKNADELAKNNNILNMENICGDCLAVLPSLVKNIRKQQKTPQKQQKTPQNQQNYDNLLPITDICVVLDPPRKGCDATVLQGILEGAPNEVIYISCNSATLARDIKILSGKYEVKSIKPFDMFPQTSHVETLCRLKTW